MHSVHAKTIPVLSIQENETNSKYEVTMNASMQWHAMSVIRQPFHGDKQTAKKHILDNNICDKRHSQNNYLKMFETVNLNQSIIPNIEKIANMSKKT